MRDHELGFRVAAGLGDEQAGHHTGGGAWHTGFDGSRADEWRTFAVVITTAKVHHPPAVR
ncbi:hypothetical protein OG738_29100 [Amycolatopsis sp. NBC_01488]|uniref:hypothetical protein n=1 Tax=Amycolatopsis sp. NBC_01488 TaxID=2903563 RepID=UPI002E2DF903|nr:hypothetical protein [Amycolatopsis sp. NBC_01488]